MPNWPGILQEAGGDKRIAEVLCAAQFWANNTVPLKYVDPERGKDGEGLPFGSLGLRRLAKHEQKYHRTFRHKCGNLLKDLRRFRDFLAVWQNRSGGYEVSLPGFDQPLLAELGRRRAQGSYRACLEACDQLIKAIENRRDNGPELNTRLQEPTKPQPHTWAGAEIFKILRRKRQKKESALAGSAELVTLFFPELRTADTNHLKDSIWQAYLRSSRVRGG